MPTKCRNFDECGNYKPPISKVKGLCDDCAFKESSKPKPQRKFKRRSIKKLKDTSRIDNWKEYTKRKITKTLKQDGKCVCAECELLLEKGLPLPEGAIYILCDDYDPNGSKKFIAHIVSGGRRPDLYLLQENSIYLCWYHHMQLDQGKFKDLLIYDEIKRLEEYVLSNADTLKTLNHNLYNNENNQDA